MDTSLTRNNQFKEQNLDRDSSSFENDQFREPVFLKDSASYGNSQIKDALLKDNYPTFGINQFNIGSSPPMKTQFQEPIVEMKKIQSNPFSGIHENFQSTTVLRNFQLKNQEMIQSEHHNKREDFESDFYTESDLPDFRSHHIGPNTEHASIESEVYKSDIFSDRSQTNFEPVSPTEHIGTHNIPIRHTQDRVRDASRHKKHQLVTKDRRNGARLLTLPDSQHGAPAGSQVEYGADTGPYGSFQWFSDHPLGSSQRYHGL